MPKLLLICALFSAPLAADDGFLKWMDRIAQQQLSKREAGIAKIQTVAEAESRKAAVRAKILELIGGLPDYNGPLNAKITGQIEAPGYLIEKVILESLPQFYITANLYRPKRAGRYPGVLVPLGHWEQGKPAVQRIAANLAMKGFVVLAYDPIGQGERLQAYDRRLRAALAGGSVDQHLMAGAQSVLAGASFARYRIWDAKRALDYLVSRPEVDRERIGCTGCSGGGTVTTYISALDTRIKVAAPACYMNTFRLLFSGPTGDSEQTIPGFLSSDLDLTDYVELFAPKPWLIVSTVGDFFPLEGARHVYQEAQQWYRLYQAADKIRWAIGPGGHGTPVELREQIYEWMIRWLKDGRGDAKELPVEMEPDFKLFATETGQVESRELYQIILDDFRRRKVPGSSEQMLAEIRKWSQPGEQRTPAIRVVSETPGSEFRTQQIAIETEPGLEIAGRLYSPNAKGRKPAVLLIDSGEQSATRLAQAGQVVLSLQPRGWPAATAASHRFAGDWVTNTRAWLIGRNLAGMRAGDVMRGVDLLVARPDVNAAAVTAAARNIPGVWLLMAAAIDPRISRVWVDRTPYSLAAAMENPLHRNLHDALIPGFALHWDLGDLVKAISPRRVIWTDPTDWMGTVVPNVAGSLYRAFEQPDDRFLDELISNGAN